MISFAFCWSGIDLTGRRGPFESLRLLSPYLSKLHFEAKVNHVDVVGRVVVGTVLIEISQ